MYLLRDSKQEGRRKKKKSVREPWSARGTWTKKKRSLSLKSSKSGRSCSKQR